MTFVHILIYVSTCLAPAQALTPEHTTQPQPATKARHADDGLPRWRPPAKKKTVRSDLARYSPLAAAGGYQGQTRTWYDVLFDHLNPKNIDWGAVLEERKENLRDNMVHNPFAWYAVGGLLLAAIAVTGWLMTRADREIILRECDQQVTRMMRLAEEGKSVAREAVAQYNAHVDKCNLVAGALASGRAAPEMSDYAQWKQRYEKVLVERSDLQAEVARLEAELTREKAQIGNLIARLDELERRPKDKEYADGESRAMLVARIGRLQDDLTRSNEETRKWKAMAQRGPSPEVA